MQIWKLHTNETLKERIACQSQMAMARTDPFAIMKVIGRNEIVTAPPI
jgi:hypothetical protein